MGKIRGNWLINSPSIPTLKITTMKHISDSVLKSFLLSLRSSTGCRIIQKYEKDMIDQLMTYVNERSREQILNKQKSSKCLKIYFWKQAFQEKGLSLWVVQQRNKKYFTENIMIVRAVRSRFSTKNPHAYFEIKGWQALSFGKKINDKVFENITIE